MIHRLHYGRKRRPLIEVVPDTPWPGMWRLRTPDGTLSDLVNLARAKDAAMAAAERGPPRRNARLFHWKLKRRERPAEPRPSRRVHTPGDMEGRTTDATTYRAVG